MSDYSITLTAEQDTALDTLIERVNALNAAQNPPLDPITKADYIQTRSTEVAESYRLQLAAEEEKSVIDSYKLADDITKSEIKTKLGL